MITISDILLNVERGCLVHNMAENEFSYRIMFCVYNGNKRTRKYVDTSYANLRNTLENIIRNNLSLTNTIVISAVTARKSGKTVSLISRSYSFSLDGYFEQIIGRRKKEYKTANYGRRRLNWC